MTAPAIVDWAVERARVNRPVRLGTVVHRIPDRSHDRPQRGVVVWAYGRGDMKPFGFPLFANDHYIIRVSAGTHVCGDDDDRWYRVPTEEWTTEERVRCALAGYETPDWYPDGAAEITDNDTWIFAGLRALLSPAAVEQIFPEDGDWPTAIDELLYLVAGWIDDRAKAERTLGTALGRLR